MNTSISYQSTPTMHCPPLVLTSETICVALHSPLLKNDHGDLYYVFDTEAWTELFRQCTHLKHVYAYWIWHSQDTIASITLPLFLNQLATLHIQFLTALRFAQRSPIQITLLLHGCAVLDQTLKRLANPSLLNYSSTLKRFTTEYPHDLPAFTAPFAEYSQVAMGGTFDHFHAGHQLLFTAAGILAKQSVVCGLTDTSILTHKAFFQQLESYSAREASIRRYFELAFPHLQLEIVPLFDPYGPSIIYEDLNALVATKETVKNAEKINSIREEKGLRPLALLWVPVISEHQIEETDSHLKLSSTKIRETLTERGSSL